MSLESRLAKLEHTTPQGGEGELTLAALHGSAGQLGTAVPNPLSERPAAGGLIPYTQRSGTP